MCLRTFLRVGETSTQLLERRQRLQFSMLMLDDKVLGNLTSLPPADQANVLRQFFRTEIPSMKNPSAYLSGIIRSSKAPLRNNMNSGRMKGSPVGRQLENMYRQYDFALRHVDLREELHCSQAPRCRLRPPLALCMN